MEEVPGRRGEMRSPEEVEQKDLGKGRKKEEKSKGGATKKKRRRSQEEERKEETGRRMR